MRGSSRNRGSGGDSLENVRKPAPDCLAAGVHPAANRKQAGSTGAGVRETRVGGRKQGNTSVSTASDSTPKPKNEEGPQEEHVFLGDLPQLGSHGVKCSFPLLHAGAAKIVKRHACATQVGQHARRFITHTGDTGISGQQRKYTNTARGLSQHAPSFVRKPAHISCPWTPDAHTTLDHF